MGRTKNVRLLVAVALAIGLWQFVRLGGIRFVSGVPRHGPWDVWIWPWLSGVLVAAPVVVLSIATGCLMRPRRPERVAAKLAAVVGFLVLVVPRSLPTPGTSLSGLGTDLLLGKYRQAVERLIQALSSWSSPGEAYRIGYLALALSWLWVAPLAVACWMGANYWRCESWPAFWRGPGGAILKGALAGGAAGVALALPVGYYHRSVLIHMAAQRGFHLHPLNVAVALTMSLSSLPEAATITGLLTKWRPRARSGAFAGSGLSLAVAGVSLVLGAVGTNALGFPISAWVMARAAGIIGAVIVGAVAGAFAGQWESEPDA